MYIVQRLKPNRLDPVALVCIVTIQRLDSMLRGDPDLDPTLEEGSQFDTGAGLITEPVPWFTSRRSRSRVCPRVIEWCKRGGFGKG